MDLSPIDGFPSFRILKIKSPLMQGDDVREVQQALVLGGFLTLANVNGDYDDTTKTAVEQFQSQMHLGIDGVVGDKHEKN
ncbi:MAG: peptidoglycan-binding protein [Pseudanabaena sp. RU_4_16]|nr:peptidoglycan-binding protein [Pseudanabaena sp. RU_4_16]